MYGLRKLMVVSAGCLALATSSSALAHELLADSVALDAFVKAGASKVGAETRICSNGGRRVVGRYQFDTAYDLAGQLLEKGHPVLFDEASNTLTVGCDAATNVVREPDFVSSIGNAGAEQFSPSYRPIGTAPAPIERTPPEPSQYSTIETRNSIPERLAESISRFPGLEVIGDPIHPGPLLLVGPASIVGEAEAYIRAVDRCLPQVLVEALVVTVGKDGEQSRSLGVALDFDGATRIGIPQLDADAFLSIGPLKAFLSGLRVNGEVRQNASLRSLVIEGETVTLADGQDVPVRGQTVVSDGIAVENVDYRTVGHNLSLELRAAGNDATMLIEHELSSVTGEGALGPRFATRSTLSTIRVPYGVPQMISLTGIDQAARIRRRGLLSRSDSVSSSQTGSYLIFALERVPCGSTANLEGISPMPLSGPGAERSESAQRSAAPGAGNVHEQ